MLLASFALAGTLAGVSVPDSASIGSAPIALNGIGLREKFYIDVYVGALYLTHPTHDGNTAINADEPKRIVMHFIYSKVTKEQIVETFEEQFGENPSAVAARPNINKMESWIPAEVHAGDEIVFDYVPGTGTTMKAMGKVMGTIPGADFMKLVWGVYLGPKPPTADLKSGMLGK